MDDNRYYGVWLPDLAKNGVWFVSGATGEPVGKTKVVKHYTDGKQPTVSTVASVEVVIEK